MRITNSILRLLKFIRSYKAVNSQRYFVGAAVLDKKNNILGLGMNSYLKTHPVQKEFSSGPYNQFLHAEVAALVNSAGTRTPDKIVVIRTNRRGDLLNARPCLGCMKAIKAFGLRTLIFSNEEGLLEEEKI